MVGAGLPVVRWSRFDSFADVMTEIRLLGAAVGEEARAEVLAGGIEALLADLERRLAGVRRVRVLYYDPPTYTMGRGTLVGEILTIAPVARTSSRSWASSGRARSASRPCWRWSRKRSSCPTTPTTCSTLRALGGDAIWRQVPAVRAGRVHEIPGAWIATVSHHAAQGLARVARRPAPRSVS